MKKLKKYLRVLFPVFIILAYAIDISAQKIQFESESLSVGQFFNEIEKQSDFLIVYGNADIDAKKEIRFSKNTNDIESYLKEALNKTDITYEIDNNHIILSKVDSEVDLKTNNVAVQQRTVSGVVRDASGNSLPGVNVVVVGTTVGTMTDMDGRYSLPVPAGSTSLSFSFIGMIAQTVPIGNQTTINITLEEEAIGLDEIVVVGYGTTVKSSVTGSISTVNTDQLQSFSASTNVVDAMQASISGALVLAQSGEPGALSNIYLRGPVSVNGGNPLYVVDGVPMDDMGYKFNPDDIESVSVLKDASAAAIYGAKAAGGVILVTTKRGTQSPLKIRANASFGIRNALYLPDVMNRDQFLEARRAFGTDVMDWHGPESGWSSLPDVNWFDEILRTGKDQNYGISLTGGNNVSSYFISGNYNRVDGVAIDNFIKRYTLRINTDHQITKRLKFSQGLFFKAGEADPTGGVMNAAFRQRPTMAVYDAAAIDNRGFAKVTKGFQGNNKVQQLIDRNDINKDYSLNLNGTLSYEIIDGLKASVFGSTTIDHDDRYNYVYPYSNGAFTGLPSLDEHQLKRQDYIATYTLNYNKVFGNHNISALAGYEARKLDKAEARYRNSITLVPEAQHSDLVESATNTVGNFLVNGIDDRILSQFGRIEYTYNSKYLFTGNIRRDGYGSKFASDYKYGVFPGASLGWVMSRENFMQQFSSVVELLKLRAGYGMLGNAIGTDFAYSSFYEAGWAQDWGDGKISGIRLASQLANPEIRWESVATTNFGLDGVLWKGVLSFNFDYYSRQTKDMLYNIPIALSSGMGTLQSGVSTVQANVGQMSNKGWELFVEFKNNVARDMEVSVGVNLGHNKNKLISLSDEIDRLFIGSNTTSGGGESGAGFYGNIYPNRSEPGQPLGQFYGLQTTGIYQTQADADAGPRVNTSAVQHDPAIGDLGYVDQNGDNRITTADYVYIGNPWPKLTYGLTLGATWKKMIDIRAVFSGTLGNDIYNVTESYEYNFQSDYTSSPKIFDASFFGSNGLTDIPRNATVSRPDNNGNWRLMSDYHVQDGSYIQLKTLSIGFTFPKSVTSMLNIDNAKLTLSGENLFILTKYKGLTPIVAPWDRNIMNQGVELPSGRYPLSRLLSVGLNIDF
ncbi:MAG: TonB-dependent receptor [Bacteroidales bacterium]|jgi:TonB-linked SusC/RagA family outer membrane protein|nr:TonB-dependent receptor [Bacteroidales bacterium]